MTSTRTRFGPSALSPSGRRLMQHLHHHLRTSLHGLNWAHALLRGDGLSRDAAMHVAVADANARLLSSYTELLLEYLEVCGQRDGATPVTLDALTEGIASDVAAGVGGASPIRFEHPVPDIELAGPSAARCRYLVRTIIEGTLEGQSQARFTVRVSRRGVSNPNSWLVFDIVRAEVDRRAGLAAIHLTAAPVDELRDLLVAALVDALGGACRRDRNLGTARLVIPVAEERALQIADCGLRVAN